jgi:hypothetical protein
MQVTQPSPLSSLILRAAVIVIISIIFTRLCVAESRKIGRLCTAPNYDDVAYFQEAAIMDQSIKAEGIKGFWTFLNERGLHSPYSVFLAAASFAVLGFRDASPYYGDALLLAAYLFCIGWLFRRLPFWPWLAALILFLTPPFVTMGVVEFRPDIAWAVATGFGVVLIVTSEKLFRTPKRAAVAGAFLAAALIIKPPTFAMTVVLFSGAILSQAVAAIREKGWRSDWRAALPGAGIFFLVVAVAAGPYWARFGRDTWTYFIDTCFGKNKALWAFHGTWAEAWQYYITGQGGETNLATPGSIILGLAAVCAIWLSVRRPDARWNLFALASLASAALFINVVAQNKSPYLGGGFYGILLFGSAYILAEAYSSPQPETSGGTGSFKLLRFELLYHYPPRAGAAKRVWRVGALALAALICAFCYRWPLVSDWSTDVPRNKNLKAADRFIKTLLDAHIAAPPKSVLLVQSGPIVMENVGIWFSRHGLKSHLLTGIFFRTTEEFKSSYPTCDWVVLQEQQVMGSTFRLPVEAVLPEATEIIKSDPLYSVLAEFADRNGRKVWIFGRRPES